MVTGANKTDTHIGGVEQARDFPQVELADLRVAVAGDPCARCDGGRLEASRGIEVGQIFYLGKKYSQSMGATYLDCEGEEKVMEMGTYGIGVSRTMAAVVEQNNDERGIVWPLAIAPYEVVIVPVALVFMIESCNRALMTTNQTPPLSEKADESIPDWYLLPADDPNFVISVATAADRDIQVAVGKDISVLCIKLNISILCLQSTSICKNT